MKRIVVFLMLCTFSLSVTACGNKAESGSTGQISGEPQESTGSTQESGTSSQEAVSDDVSAGGDFPDEEGNWSPQMEQVKGAVVDALGEDYWPNMQLTPDLLEMSYGITADLYDDYLAEVPMISTNVDTLLIIQAKSDMADDVAELLHSYHESQVNDALQYPMNIGKVQAARIERIGDYVCFVRLGAGAVDEEDTNTVIALCQDQNELVIEIIRQNL